MAENSAAENVKIDVALFTYHIRRGRHGKTQLDHGSPYSFSGLSFPLCPPPLPPPNKSSGKKGAL